MRTGNTTGPTLGDLIWSSVGKDPAYKGEHKFRCSDRNTKSTSSSSDFQSNESKMNMLGVLSAILVVSSLAMGIDGLCMPEHPQTQLCNADYVIRVKVKSPVMHEAPSLPELPQQSRGSEANPSVIGNTPLTGKSKMTPPGQIRGVPRAGIPNSGRNERGYPLRSVRYHEVIIKRIMKGEKKVNATKSIRAFTKGRNTRYYGRVYVTPGVHLEAGKAYLLAGKLIMNKLWINRCQWHTEWDALSKDQIFGLKKHYLQGCNKCKVQLCYSERDCQRRKALDNCMWKLNGFFPRDDCYVMHSACQKMDGKCEWRNEQGLRMCKTSKNKTKALPF